MKIKIKDKYFKLGTNTIDNQYFIQQTEANKIDLETYEVLPKVINFKLLYKLTTEKEELKSYFKELVINKNSYNKDVFKDYNYLYQFQKDGIDKILNSSYGGYLLSFEQGLGKTLTSLVTANIRKENNIWIVAPASLLNQWKDEIKHWLKEDCIIYNGTKVQREKSYNINSKWNIISYETLRNDYDKNLNLKRRLINSFMIFDESTKLKNKKTILYKTFKGICLKSKFRLFLTGTPVNNKLQDIDNVIKLIDKSIITNVNDYIIWEQRTVGWGMNAKVFMEQVGYKNVDEYVEKIKSIYYRKTKEEVAPDLPKKNIITFNINQTKLHHKIKDNILNTLSAFEGFTLLELLECGVEVFNKSESENAELTMEETKGKIENPKINILKDLLQEINNQVIIFCSFKQGCSLIALELEKEFKDKKIAIVTADTKNKDEIATKFKNKEIDIVIATDTWAKGISFPDIDYLIYYNISPSYEMYFQKQDRIHRINSTTPKFIYNLVGDVIEEHIMELLKEKTKLAEQITEGKGESLSNFDLKKELIRKLGWN